MIDIEDTLSEFLEVGVSYYEFNPMPAEKRLIIHELCVHYGCTSLSYGTDLGRFVRVTVNK